MHITCRDNVMLTYATIYGNFLHSFVDEKYSVCLFRIPALCITKLKEKVEPDDRFLSRFIFSESNTRLLLKEQEKPNRRLPAECYV